MACHWKPPCLLSLKSKSADLSPGLWQKSYFFFLTHTHTHHCSGFMDTWLSQLVNVRCLAVRWTHGCPYWWIAGFDFMMIYLPSCLLRLVTGNWWSWNFSLTIRWLLNNCIEHVLIQSDSGCTFQTNSSFSISRTMSKIFKLIEPRGEEAETVQSTSDQPASETDWSLCFICQEMMQESLMCPSQKAETWPQFHYWATVLQLELTAWCTCALCAKRRLWCTSMPSEN